MNLSYEKSKNYDYSLGDCRGIFIVSFIIFIGFFIKTIDKRLFSCYNIITAREYKQMEVTKMSKFNKSEIMKNAWSIRRNNNVSMSEALKAAWANAKKPSNPVFEGFAEIDGFEFNLWEKHGLRRIYINNRTGRNKSNAGGYINLDNMNIVATGSVKSAARRFLDMYEVA